MKITSKHLLCILAFVVASFTLLRIVYYLPSLQLIHAMNSLRHDETNHPFKHIPQDDLYIYSAIVEATPALELTKADVVITVLDRARDSFVCCVLVDSDHVTTYVTQARPYYIQTNVPSDPSTYFAKQYRCPSTWHNHKPKYVALTSLTCSSNIHDYVPVVYIKMHPGELAICAKGAFSPGLDAQKIVEWFEMQRLLGVDKVLIYNLGVDEIITKIFNHYTNLGVLLAIPFELPGAPRNLSDAFKRTNQFYQDETFPVLECKLRTSGYDFVLSHDLDEFVIPRENVPLKELFKIHALFKYTYVKIIHGL